MKAVVAGGCPCGSGQPYADCCEPLHRGVPASSAEALMRSRYSAYVLRLGPYLLASWHPDTRPPSVDVGDGAEAVTRWLGLTIKSQAEIDDTAMVEFVARFKVGGTPAQRIHELSRFVRENGRWLYLDGLVR